MTRIRQLSDGVLVQDLPAHLDPVDALVRIGGVPGSVLLHSAGSTSGYSLLSADPIQVLRIQRVRAGGAARSGYAAPGGAIGDPDPFSALANLLAHWRMPPPEGIPFAGGVIGFMAYEAGDALERLPAPPPDDLGVPDVWFGVYDRAILWDRPTGTCRAVASILPGTSRAEATRRLEELVLRVSGSGGGAPEGGNGGSHVSGAALGDADLALPQGIAPEGVSSLSRSAFIDGVERIREYIRAGDLFQANLTRRISVATALSGIDLFRRLLQGSPAAYSAYLNTGDGEVASISPELFLSVRSGRVKTFPIKGTAPRGRTPDEDQAFAAALERSEKDRAENVMIVDLLRNDLSRVCLPGSIEVPRLAELEALPTVHHLVSTVTGVLDPRVGAHTLLRSTFPGGSISGAPKIRAMEVLRGLEPVRRGVYTGALGVLGFHGDLDLSVAIRTAVVKEGRAHYGTGGGITLSSNPADEWTETEDKAGAFLRAIRAGGG